MPRALTLADLAAVNGEALREQEACHQAVPPAPLPAAPPDAPCARPNVAGMSSTQAILALMPCYSAVGAAARRGYHLDGDSVLAMIGASGVLPLATPGTTSIPVSAQQAINGAGPTCGVASLSSLWTVESALVAGPLDTLLNLLCAKSLLEYAQGLAADWTRTNSEGIGVGAHIDVGAGI